MKEKAKKSPFDKMLVLCNAEVQFDCTPEQKTNNVYISFIKVILDILGLTHQYGFQHLEVAISDYLREILNIKNACLIFDATRLYQLDRLTKVCQEYMDKHALELIQHESFLQLSPSALTELVSRDSFYAPEIDIFTSVQSWVKANSDVDATNVLGPL